MANVPATELVLTMCASSPGCSRILGTNARTPWTGPMRFTPSVHSQSVSGVSTSGEAVSTPALLHSRCTALNASYARAASSSSDSREETSARTPMASPPSSRTSLATRAAWPSSTSPSTTRIPAAWQAWASPSPMPLPPPVITATRPSSCSIAAFPPPAGYPPHPGRLRQQAHSRRTPSGELSRRAVQATASRAIESMASRISVASRGSMPSSATPVLTDRNS